MAKSKLLVHGMHGMGDNIHQRAIIRQLMKKYEVWLETSWASLYHDLAGPSLHLINKRTHLRTQAKNAAREAGAFELPPPRADFSATLRVRYTPERVRALGSVLAAMCEATETDYSAVDFRLKVPRAWVAEAKALVGDPGRPIMFYRPLVNRPKDWGGCLARNPAHDTYFSLASWARKEAFLVSIADLEDDKEWEVGHDIAPDLALHKGELTFEGLAGLMSISAFAFTSPGFAVPLAQAVGTPVVTVFGGYESSRSFAGSHVRSPYLGIDTINPCECFRHDHACDKRISLKEAIPRMMGFIHGALAKQK